MDELTQARIYCNRVVSNGPWWLVEIAKKNEAGKAIFWNQAFETGNDAASFAVSMGKFTGNNVYLCQSSLTTSAMTPSKRDPTSLRRTAARQAPNAAWQRALRIDVDVASAAKKTKCYATTEEALGAVLSACTKAGFPQPTMWVYSGSGGVHAYWTLSEALRTAEWEPLARAFVKLLDANGLDYYDRPLSFNPVLLLRVPGTKNYKDPTQPKPVTLCDAQYIKPYDEPIDTIRALLKPYVVPTAPLPSRLTPGPATVVPITPAVAQLIQVSQAAPHTDDNEFSSGIERRKVQALPLSATAAVCPVIASQIASRGAQADRNFWKLMLNAASFTDDPHGWAHAVSDGHPSYTAEETDKELQETLDWREKKGQGWPSCASFSAHAPAVCKACPNYLLGKSPFNFSMPQPAAAQAVPPGDPNEMPTGFERRNGVILQFVRDKDTGQVDEVPALIYDVQDPYLFESEYGEMLGFKVLMPAQTKKVELRTSVIATGGKDLTAALGRYGIMHITRSTQEFCMAWVEQLQARKDRLSQNVPMYGWYLENGTELGFSYAGRCYVSDGTERDTPRLLIGWESDYEPSGTLANWQNAANLIAHSGSPALCAIVAAAFASPLVHFSGLHGTVMAAYSQKSGLGKSAAIKVAQSVWGNPVTGLQQLKDTEASVIAKAGKLKHLPMFWDELQHSGHVQKFIDITFTLSSGKEKARSSSDMRAMSIGSWELLMTVASNQSVRDIMKLHLRNTEAGMLRVFEFEVRGAPPNDHVEAQSRLALTTSNYGHAGLVYSQWLARNPAKAKATYMAALAWVKAAIGINNDERFWAMLVASLMAGATIARNLGLVDLNVQALGGYLKSVYAQMRAARTDALSDYTQPAAMLALLQEFLDDLGSRHLLRTDYVMIGPGRQKIVMMNDNPNMLSVRAQQGQRDGVLRFSKTAFHQFLTRHKITVRGVEEALLNVFNAREISAILGGHTPHRTTTTVRLWELNFFDTHWDAVAGDIRAESLTGLSANSGSPSPTTP